MWSKDYTLEMTVKIIGLFGQLQLAVIFDGVELKSSSFSFSSCFGNEVPLDRGL